MGEDAEKRIPGPRSALAKREQRRRRQQANDADADDRVEIEDQTQRHPQQRGMSERGAEIGHPPPHHEHAERAGDERRAAAADECPDQKIIHRLAYPPAPRG